MVEINYLKSGNNELSYSCVIPHNNTKTIGIVFVHAAYGNRLGPHRMFVEYAEKFNSLGYPTFRFDLTGCGDSTGNVLQDDISSDIFDAIETVKFFTKKENLDRIILFGISRGARVCYEVMTQHDLPLKGMILLSTPISSNRAALKTFNIRLREYMNKIRDPKHLWKLLSGRANIRQILKTLITALSLRHRYTKTQLNIFTSKCPILFIYGKGDSLTEESSCYYISKCKENNVPCECHYIENANHSFFHYKWKEEIIDITQEWLERIMN